jgi:hypothetical protein
MAREEEKRGQRRTFETSNLADDCVGKRTKRRVRSVAIYRSATRR